MLLQASRVPDIFGRTWDSEKGHIGELSGLSAYIGRGEKTRVDTNKRSGVAVLNVAEEYCG